MKDEYLEISNDVMLKMVLKSKEFRNSVAFAHGVQLRNLETFKGTCSYPKRYRVSEEMIQTAKAIKSRATKKTLKQNKNNLLWVGMGWHKAESGGNVGNCRIQTVLKNNDGKKIFVEFGSGHSFDKSDKKNYLNCDYCFIVEEKGNDYQEKETHYNYLNLEKSTRNKKIEFTSENILNYVNKELNCSFKKMFVDNFDIYLEKNQTICESINA